VDLRSKSGAEAATDTYFEAMEGVPSSVYYGLAAASIVASAYLFFTGKRTWALFVGQWPPTIIALALMYKVLRPSRED
jgi:hypothetical protein